LKNDYLGRRITKQAYSWVSSAWATSGAQEIFIYEGWNLIARIDGSTLTKNYFWGIDRSETMQGAGGVGGCFSRKKAARPTCRVTTNRTTSPQSPERRTKRL
jgi:hypothetical protein